MTTYVDRVVLHVAAGDGGHGVASVKREKFKPLGGPDGGNGGRGGDVVLRVDPQSTTLLDYHHHPHRKAENGRPGAGDERNGADGADLVLPVPAGTVVTDASGEVLADLVGPEDLPNAIALNNANMNLTRVLGPALAGFLIAAPSVGVGGVFLIMAGLYVLVVATILQVRGGRQRAASTRRSGVEQLVEGLAYIRSSQRLLMLLTLGFIPMLLGMHYQMLMPVFALGLHKPQLFFLVPLVLLCWGRWRALAGWAVTAGLLGAVSLRLVGFDGV